MLDQINWQYFNLDEIGIGLHGEVREVCLFLLQHLLSTKEQVHKPRSYDPVQTWCRALDMQNCKTKKKGQTYPWRSLWLSHLVISGTKPPFLCAAMQCQTFPFTFLQICSLIFSKRQNTPFLNANAGNQGFSVFSATKYSKHSFP